ncbi:MAG: hypothetical protein ACI9SE_004200, partial [Neolewinella sp.]
KSSAGGQHPASMVAKTSSWEEPPLDQEPQDVASEPRNC